MTELAVPPIAVRARHPYWRYKDTYGPIIAETFAAVASDATIPDGSVPYVNHIYGTGKTGKNLLIYNGIQWVPIPVGVGEDSYLASVNVWDEKKQVWFTPDWVFKQPADTEYPFDVRVKNGQVYDDRSGLNTNYSSSHNSYTDPDAGFLRLFYAHPRTDPLWRIVDLLQAYPSHSPSTKVQANEYIQFAPRGGRYTTGYTNYYTGSQQLATPYFFPYGPISYSDGYDINQLCRAEYDTYSNPTYNTIPGFQYPVNGYTQTAGMLDLKSMKAQMADKFPNRLPDYTGQYDSIVLMHNQRLFITGVIEFVIEYGANDADVTDVNVDQMLKNIDFGVYSTTNYPGVEMPATDYSYQPRYPVDTIASGNRFVQEIGLPGAAIQVSDGGSGHFMRLSFNRYIQVNLEGPGEDNIRFSASVDNVPTPAFTSSTRTVQSGGFGPPSVSTVPYPTFIRASVQFIPQQMLLHYTEGQTDTPADHNYEDFGLGLFQVT
jgi:hypothetical protein